jgi:hypothetical protein
MKKFWALFWKLFGAAFFMALLTGITLGIVQHSGSVTYLVVQKIIAIGLGICGVISFVVVPAEMYFEDRRNRDRVD